jgi:hypothetical protein
VAVSIPHLPLLQRLRFKDPDDETTADFDLSKTSGSIDDVGEEFWHALDGLDRGALHRDTLRTLEAMARNLSLGELAEVLPPTHDLETLAFWLGLGRESEAEFHDDRETCEIPDRHGILTRFDVPLISLEAAAVARVDLDTLG